MIDNQMHQRHFFTAAAGQTPLRVDTFLYGFIQNTSRSRIQKAIKEGFFLVNGKVIKRNYLVRPFDEVAFFHHLPPPDQEILPENIPLDVIYEDESLLILNKPAGMVVHPGHGNYTGTLVHALAYRFRNLPLSSSLYRHGLVHRIDKDTTGLLVVAKTDQAMFHLAKQFSDHVIDRKYIALVWGVLKDQEGTISNYIGRSSRDRKMMTVLSQGQEGRGKWAVTHYKVIERFSYATLVECRLETGRTHQIRVHFQHSGHPIFGDTVYGGNVLAKGVQNISKYRQFIQNCFSILPRQALHAYRLGFSHPITHQKMLFESKPPQDISLVCSKWKGILL